MFFTSKACSNGLWPKVMWCWLPERLTTLGKKGCGVPGALGGMTSVCSPVPWFLVAGQAQGNSYCTPPDSQGCWEQGDMGSPWVWSSKGLDSITQETPRTTNIVLVPGPSQQWPDKLSPRSALQLSKSRKTSSKVFVPWTNQYRCLSQGPPMSNLKEKENSRMQARC